MEVVVGGKYRHFKGNCYKVLLIALDSESNHEEAPKKGCCLSGSIWR